jgi:tetraacyldisaccharide 4'-kinase
MRRLLLPLGYLYGACMRVRNYFYDRGIFSSYQSALPVVSVGNLTLGGNGKTPCVLFLVEHFRAQGYRPVVLSRGYGGKAIAPQLVDDVSSSEDVGDEPVLLHAKLRVSGIGRVVVARKRALGAQFIEKNKIGDLILLDDGFQHRALRRDLDIVLASVSSENREKELFSGSCLPSGNLREPWRPALKRATHLILFTQSPELVADSKVQKIQQQVPAHLPIWCAHYTQMGVHHALTGEDLPAQSIFAFSAIAQPEAFEKSLRTLGFHIEDSKHFPDHHPLQEHDMHSLRSAAKERKLVCTEKDLVKISLKDREKIYVLSGTFAVQDWKMKQAVLSIPHSRSKRAADF